MQAHRTPTARRRELTLVHVRRRVRLPVRELRWRDDCPTVPCTAEPDTSRRATHWQDPDYDEQGTYVKRDVTAPGYHTGRPSATKGRTFPATPIDEHELLRLLAAFPLHRKTGRRDQALAGFCAWTGARISEALDVLPVDLDLEHGSVTIRRGKGGKRRLIAVAPPAVPLLTEWLDERTWQGARPHHPVFCTLQPERAVGGHMSDHTFREALANAARVADIDKRVAPHQLRHHLAVYMARLGVPVPIISKQLGHSNVATTSTYLAGITSAELVDTLQAIPWPTFKKPTERAERDRVESKERLPERRVVAPSETPESMFEQMLSEVVE